jgi:hypothetical protein
MRTLTGHPLTGSIEFETLVGEPTQQRTATATKQQYEIDGAVGIGVISSNSPTSEIVIQEESKATLTVDTNGSAIAESTASEPIKVQSPRLEADQVQTERAPLSRRVSRDPISPGSPAADEMGGRSDPVTTARQRAMCAQRVFGELSC